MIDSYVSGYISANASSKNQRPTKTIQEIVDSDVSGYISANASSKTSNLLELIRKSLIQTSAITFLSELINADVSS